VTHREVVAVGASAGGVEALRALAAALPGDLPASLLVVLHMPRTAPSALPRILNRCGPLPAVTASDGEPLRPGRIYVAPADRHLLLLEDRIRLSKGPSENGHRPAVDPMFRSVARAAGRRSVAVVLSGARDDGAFGAALVAAQGGVVLVQDPADALYGSMPRAAIARVPTALTAPAADLGAIITGLVAEEVPPHRRRAVLPWPAPGLLEEQTEGALWMALRALEEKSALSRRMAGGRMARSSYRDRFEQVAADADQAGDLIRGLIARLGEHPL
jgi:two-component system, chemotaxis family, protein-glutamate methylesterase/glutaminase